MEASSSCLSAGSLQDDIGDVQDRFELTAVLGRGAYGTVYRAVDKSLKETVAIKIISTAESDTEELQQIKKEIDFLAGCNHPNVVRYMGSYRRPDSLWIVMEYCGGGSVSDIMSAIDSGLQEELIAYICAESLKGLAYLHSLGKVHRDIKCGNILLTDTGGVKLADFGVSAQLTNTMTKRNTFIGTPHWMAPEVIQESRYDGKVDVWALGISAIEMAEVTPPRWAVHPLRVIFMISRDPPPALKDKQRWSTLMHDFIAQSLQKDAKVRPSAKYLLQHRFVLQPRQSVHSLLQPLLERSKQFLATRVSPAASLKTVKAKDLAAQATGHFSWKPATPSGADLQTMVLKSPEVATSPMRGQWAATKVGKGRMGSQEPGLSPGLEGSRSWANLDSGTPYASFDSGTMVVHGGSNTPLPAAVVMSPDAAAGRSPGGPPPATRAIPEATATVMVGGLSALNASVDESDSYMAALQSAVADRQKIKQATPRAQPPPSTGASTPQLPSAQPLALAPEMQKLKQRLHSAYEGGLVVPLPFLRASYAPPLGLLNSASTPHHTPIGHTGGVHGIDADAHQTILQLVEGSGGDAPPHSNSSNMLTELPATLVDKLTVHPGLQNLARSLAYHKRCLSNMPLDIGSIHELGTVVDDISHTLRSILCL